MTLQAQSAIGLMAIPLIAWLLSGRGAPSHRSPDAPAAGGFGLQIVSPRQANVAAMRIAFDWAAGLVGALSCDPAGMRVVSATSRLRRSRYDGRTESTFILAFHACR